MGIENIKQLMDGIDLMALLPKLESILDFVVLFSRLAVMAGPLAVLGLGLYYFLAAPKEATYSAGYRFRWGMGSVEAWQFTQRLAGMVWGILGLVLSVVMAILTTSFASMEPMDLLWQAVWLLLVEGAAIGLSCIAINIVVFSRYDRSGKRRLTWRQLFEA